MTAVVTIGSPSYGQISRWRWLWLSLMWVMRENQGLGKGLIRRGCAGMGDIGGMSLLLGVACFLGRSGYALLVHIEGEVYAWAGRTMQQGQNDKTMDRRWETRILSEEPCWQWKKGPTSLTADWGWWQRRRGVRLLIRAMSREKSPVKSRQEEGMPDVISPTSLTIGRSAGRSAVGREILGINPGGLWVIVWGTRESVCGQRVNSIRGGMLQQSGRFLRGRWSPRGSQNELTQCMNPMGGGGLLWLWRPGIG